MVGGHRIINYSCDSIATTFPYPHFLPVVIELLTAIEANNMKSLA